LKINLIWILPSPSTTPLTSNSQEQPSNTSNATDSPKEEKHRLRGRSVVNRVDSVKRALGELNERELRYWSSSELLELNHLLATTSLLVVCQMQTRLGKTQHGDAAIDSSNSLNGSVSNARTSTPTGSNHNSPRVRRRQDSVNSTGARDNNEEEWVVMEGQSRAPETSTLKSTLQKLTACSVKGCTNLGNESCPRCRARFCRDHASLLMTSTQVTRGQVMCLTCCDDMVQKVGVSRTHTGLYLTLRQNLVSAANEFVETHRDLKMQPRVKELASVSDSLKLEFLWTPY